MTKREPNRRTPGKGVGAKRGAKWDEENRFVCTGTYLAAVEMGFHCAGVTPSHQLDLLHATRRPEKR